MLSFSNAFSFKSVFSSTVTSLFSKSSDFSSLDSISSTFVSSEFLSSDFTIFSFTNLSFHIYPPVYCYINYNSLPNIIPLYIKEGVFNRPIFWEFTKEALLFCKLVVIMVNLNPFKLNN